MRGKRSLHFLDRILGIPLVWLLGLIPRRKSAIESPQSVAIMSIGCIGDTLLLAGPLADLKSAYPNCCVTLFTGGGNCDAANLIEAVDRVIPLSLARPVYSSSIIRKSGQYDICIDAGQWARTSAIYTALTRAKHHIGFSTFRQFRHYCFDTVVPHKNSIHELENFKNLFKPLGIPLQSIPKVTPKKKSALQPIGPYAVLHMYPSGLNSFMKEWPQDRWERLATHFANEGYTLLLTGSKEDRARAQIIVEKIDNPRVANIAGQTRLGELANLLAQSTFVVSVNTGIMHLAAAVDAPLVAIHGPTSSLRWGPVSQNNRAQIVLPQKISCAPCLNLGFEYGCGTPKCLQSIEVGTVIKSIDRLLKRQAFSSVGRELCGCSPP